MSAIHSPGFTRAGTLCGEKGPQAVGSAVTCPACVASNAAAIERVRKSNAEGKPPCSAPGCQREARAKGLCETHYQRQRRGGRKADLSAPLRRRDLVRVPGLRVSAACAAALDAEAERQGVPVYRVASEVLEKWASR